MMKRVVVTGIGTINAVGDNAKESFDHLIKGVCGIDHISLFDTSKSSIHIAGEVKGFDPATIIPPKDIKKSDRFIHLGLKAAKEAVEDSGFDGNGWDMNRFGVSCGAGIGGLSTISKNSIICENKSPKRVSPFFIPSSLINMLGGLVSIEYGLKGPNLSSVTACAASTHAIIEAYKSIVVGSADAMLVVGAESAISEVGIAGFANMKALSSIEDPKTASRPFDKDRAGFVMGEGAGALILEEYALAKSRGADIYAELTGFGESSDAHHITAPAPNGEGAYRAMKMAIDFAGLDHVDYINAHGTSTKFNDWYESVAIKHLFKDKIPQISSTKGHIGHCLGAAGSIEAVISIQSLKEGVIPPTINYTTKDEDCDLDYVPNEAREFKNMRTVMSNSFGFGGTNGVVLFKKV